MATRHTTPRLLRRSTAERAPSPMQHTQSQQHLPGAPEPGSSSTNRHMEANTLLLEKRSSFASEDVLPVMSTSSSVPAMDIAEHNVLKKLVVIQPDESPRTATAKRELAIRQVTAELNQRAAQRLAEGRTPEKETLIEITQIGHIGDSCDGYFSREKLQQQRKNQGQPGIFSHLKLNPVNRTARRRDSQGNTQEPHTPSPVQGDLSVESVEMTSPKYPSAMEATSSHVRPNSTPPVIETPIPSGGAFTAIKSRTLQQQIVPPTRVGGSIQPLSVQGRSISLQGRTPRDQSPVTIISCKPGKKIDYPSKNESKTFQSIASTEGNSELDDSLTNMQWLTGDGEGSNTPATPTAAAPPKSEPPKRVPVVRPIPGKIINAPKPVVRLTPFVQHNPATVEQFEVPRDLDRSQRPPYSYMHLIQLAICSTDERRMTLKQIYQWIEDTFPYYRYSSKPGWKNSIRHNLSLYDCFVREKSIVPGNVGASYWTIRADVPVKPYRPPPRPHWLECSRDDAGSPGPDRSRRKAPPLLLPKGVPRGVCSPAQGAQRYTLVPIQSGVSMVVGEKNLVVASPLVATGDGRVAMASSDDRSSKLPNIMRREDKSRLLKRSSSPASVSGPIRKQVKIAPKVAPPTLSRSSSASAALSGAEETLEDFTFDRVSGSSCTEDSGVCVTPNTSAELNIVPGLPKPTLYKQRSRRKDRHEVLMVDLSAESAEKSESARAEHRAGGRRACERSPDTLSRDSDSNSLLDYLDRLGSDLPSPDPALLQTPPKQSSKLATHKTSTPSKTSPDWVSPMRDLELTPLTVDPSLQMDSGFFTPPDSARAESAAAQLAHAQEDSPSAQFLASAAARSPGDGSLRDLGLPGYTPLKGGITPHDGASPSTSSPSLGLPNQSFTRMFGDINLDNIIEQGMDVDVANLSLSMFQ